MTQISDARAAPPSDAPTLAQGKRHVRRIARRPADRAHRRARDWTALVTLTGWALLLGGLWRVIAPAAPQPSPGPATCALLALITALGAVLSWRGYARRRAP